MSDSIVVGRRIEATSSRSREKETNRRVIRSVYCSDPHRLRLVQLTRPLIRAGACCTFACKMARLSAHAEGAGSRSWKSSPEKRQETVRVRRPAFVGWVKPTSIAVSIGGFHPPCTVLGQTQIHVDTPRPSTPSIRPACLSRRKWVGGTRQTESAPGRVSPRFRIPPLILTTFEFCRFFPTLLKFKFCRFFPTLLNFALHRTKM